MKKKKYPDGGMVYVIDYTDDGDNLYRIGMTSNMNKRKKIYDSHSAYNREVVYFKTHICPKKLEDCVRCILSDFRIKSRKDFYEVKLQTIKLAFKKCISSIGCIDNQKGGSLINKLISEKRKELKILKESSFK